MSFLTTPKGGDTKTTTQQTVLPQWLTNAQQGAVTAGQNLTSPFTSQAPPTNPVAGFNPDQQSAFDQARNWASGYGTPATTITPRFAGAAQVSPDGAAQFMNPYIQGVVDPALASARREGANRDAGIGAHYAAAGGFGGSGEALARGQNARATGETEANLVGTLMSQGYTQAQAAALANAGMRQQSELTNAQLGTQASTQQGVQDLARAQLDNDARLKSLSAFLGTGAMQQQQDQRQTDIPYTMLDRLRGTISGLGQTNSTGTTTAPNTAATPLQSILGLGATVLGAGTGGGTTIGGSLFNNMFR